MKWLTVVLLLLSVEVAWPQVKTGSVVYLDFAKDEVTIAADSRVTITGGEHNDGECKISAFGNQFVFSMTGAVGAKGWNAHTIARQIWQKQSRLEPDPVRLVTIVAKNWAIEMERIYARPDVIRKFQERNTSVLANAFFAAASKSKLARLRFEYRLRSCVVQVEWASANLA